MTRTGIIDITKTCKKELSKCAQPCNGSYPFGIEKHTFEGTLDLRKAMKAGCCRFSIATDNICCRSAYITTGPSGGFMTYLEIDACKKPCNTSPQLTNDPVAILCCNQPYFFNNGAVDTVNYDSLSYSLVTAYSSAGAKSNYTGGFSGGFPLTPYYPSGWTDKSKSNPNVDPPIGIFLDPETGDLIFTPTDCSQQAVVVMQIDEWRKDKNGKYENIGITRRDMQFIVQNCPGNNPPKITNKVYKYSVCAGTQLCFDITTEDKPFVPPPPAKTPPPDTVTLTWNRGIPGATFTIKNQKAREKTATFCWTPKKGQASDLPYSFTATAIDDNCPKSALTTRSFSIIVKPIAEAARRIDTLICGKYVFRSELFSGFKAPPAFLWEVSDIKNQPLTRTHYYFKGNNGVKSKLQKDTIQFRKGGQYIIHHQINNGVNCPTDYFDTLVVPPLLEVNLSLGPDTFVCAGTTLRLGAKVANGVPSFKYKWFSPSHNSNDTLSYLDVAMRAGDSSFRVEISDKNKCTAYDTVNIFLKPNPKVDMGPDIRICWYDSVTITPNAKFAYWIDPVKGDTLQQGDTLLWNWQYYGIDHSKDTFSRIAKRGLYTVTVSDSLGCNYTDTMNLLVNDTLFPSAGPDQIRCYNDDLVLKASGLDTFGNKKKGTYRWYKGSQKTPPVISTKQQFTFKIQNSNNYLLELMVQEDTLKCYGFDTINIKVNPLPLITMATPQKYCCDYGNISLGSSLFGSPTGGVWSCRQNPSFVSGNTFLTPSACNPKKAGIFTLIYTYTEPTTSCVNVDSTRFTINPLPGLRFDGGTICQNAIKVKLKPTYIKAPNNLNSMTDVKFRLLKTIAKTGGGLCTVNDIVPDDDPSLNYDFSLIVSNTVMNLGTSSKDSIQLEITVQDGEGCFNRDSAWFYIVKVPTISFSGFPDLCIDKGIVNLTTISNTKPISGVWSVVDSAGLTKPKALLQIGLDKNNGDTLDTKKLSTILGPGLYKLRYTDWSSGCYIKRDTLIRINPLPNVNINISPNNNASKYCEIDADVTLNANPAGGLWTSNSSVPGILGGGKFKPSLVPPSEMDKWLTLTYTYVNPTTKCDTAKSLQVYVQSKPTIDILTNDTSYCRSNLMNISLKASYAHTSKITWYQSADVLIANFEGNLQSSNNNPATYTIRPRGDSTTTILISAYTEAERVCPFDQKSIILTINPIPRANINVSDPDGCVPHTVNFVTTMLNGVDASKATYKWNFGDGGNDVVQNPTHTFTKVGNSNVSLLITSAEGCDTSITLPINVYPIPTAEFTPNPNNKTTSALPRFRFTNNSIVVNTLASKITKNMWDFGDLNSNTDTSTLLNPEYFYNSDTNSYWVSLIVETNHGCRDTVSKMVIVGPDILVYIPNAFTPGGAGPVKNDKFQIQASGYKTYHLIVFNRWGERLFESDKLEDAWDGNYQSAPCQMDVYVYEVQVTSFVDKLYKYSGTVTLLR